MSKTHRNEFRCTAEEAAKVRKIRRFIASYRPGKLPTFYELLLQVRAKAA